MKKPLETCPTCGKGKLHPKLIDHEFVINEQHVVIRGIRVDACDNCDEEVMDIAEIERAKNAAKQQVINNPPLKRAVGGG